jgi:hypothetical protein
VSALVHATHAALDRRDLAEARSWLAQLPVPPPDTGAVKLVLARLAQVEGKPGAAAQLEQLALALPADRGSRRLRWQAQSLLAAQACLEGRMDEGRRLRAATLEEVEKSEPEHARQRRRLEFLSAPCVPGASALARSAGPQLP